MLFAFLQIILKIANPKIMVPKIAKGTTTTTFSLRPTINPRMTHNLV